MFNKNISKILFFLCLSASTPAAFAKGSVKTSTTKKAKSKKKPRVSREYIEQAFVEASEKTGVPKDLLIAICTIESNLDPDAFVHADGGDRNHAFGLCQILNDTAWKYVRKDPNCYQDFTNLPRNHKACKLFGPKVNALIAARYLKDQLDRYQGDMFKASAAYNSGSVLKCSKKGWVTNKKGENLKKCKPGDVLNRYYLERLQSVLTKLDSIIRQEFAEADVRYTMPSKHSKQQS